MLAVQQFLLATSLLCSATGCGDEAKKSSGLSMSVTADNSQRLTLVSHENKFDRINSFNGGHEQMMGENDTDELQTNVNNCSNALVANEYLSRNNSSNNSKHDIPIINNGTRDLLNLIPVSNFNLTSRALPKNYPNTTKRIYVNSSFEQNESKPLKHLQHLEQVAKHQPHNPSSLDQVKDRNVLKTDEKNVNSMAQINNQNFSSGTSRSLVFPSSVKTKPRSISNRKYYKYFLKNRRFNSDNKISRLESSDSYFRNNQGTQLSKKGGECSKHDSKTRTKRNRERYRSLSSLLRHSSSDRLGIFVADNTGFDPKTTSDRSHTEISNTNSVLKNMQRTLENEKSGNSSKETRTESLEGHVFKSVEGIQFPKQPVMLSLSPDSNESYVSYPLEPDLPSPDIVPLEDLRTDVEEAPRNRSLPGDPKRPYFPIEKAPVGNENAVDSNRSSGLLDNDWTPLRCITCSSTTDHTHCYNLPHPNQTDNFDDEDLSQECLYRHETYCLASHVWYVDKTEENKPYHHFSIERRCATDCKPYYIVMGDKTKMEIIINRTCCMTDNCNRRNTAEGTPLKSQHIYKVSFAVLIVFKLMLHF